MSLQAPEPTSRAGRAVFAHLDVNPFASLSEIMKATEAVLGHAVDHKTASKYRRSWRAQRNLQLQVPDAPPGAVA